MATDASSSPSLQPPRFIDIGANLTDGVFQGCYHGKQYHEPDLREVLQRGWDAGVDRIMITAGTLPEAREALELAEKMDGDGGGGAGAGDRRRLFTTVGVHPTHCGEFEASGDAEGYLAELVALATRGSYKNKNGGEEGGSGGSGGGGGEGRVVAVGECGLDYDRLQFCPRETQMEWFERQFEISEATGLPMFLHMRAAAEDFTAILVRNRRRFTAGVVHSFTGTAEEAEALIAVVGAVQVDFN
jgi:TatD DNase family protein